MNDWALVSECSDVKEKIMLSQQSLGDRPFKPSMDVMPELRFPGYRTSHHNPWIQQLLEATVTLRSRSYTEDEVAWTRYLESQIGVHGGVMDGIVD